MKKISFFAFLFLMGCTARNGDTNNLKMVVGTYTDTGSYGLYSYDFNEDTSTFDILDSCKLVNPSYLTISDNKDIIYSVSELHDDNAAIVALKFNSQNGSFEILNSQKTIGLDPCYVATNGKVVVTANYGGSMSVFPINEDGRLGEMSQLFTGEIGGPDSIRQDTPHIHCTEFSVDQDHLFVSDFSADRLLVYRVEEDGSRIVPLVSDSTHQLAIELDPDYGPRHIVFDRSGKHAYVIGELSGNISVLDVKGDIIKVKQVVKADSVQARGSADIHISPDGKFLYASNRLENDGIAIFRIDSITGELFQIGYQLTGIHPRNFAITPNGKYLLCACRDTNEIQIFEIDKSTGLLKNTGNKIAVKKPVCIKFIDKEEKF